MQKKKLLCALLVVAMLFTNLNITAFATEITDREEEPITEDVSENDVDGEGLGSGESGASLTTEHMSIEANNGLGELLMEDLQSAGQEAARKSQRLYSVVDVVIEEKTAIVSYYGAGDATLIVGIYEEDTAKPVVYGTKPVPAGENEAQLELPIASMPQYFEVKAYLVNSVSLRPLSEEFVSPMYTRTMQEFLAKTTDDFPAERVANLDESRETNFLVVKDTTALAVQEAGVNELVSYDAATRTYIFENINEKITDLVSGKAFVYQHNGSDITAFTVETITIEGSTATIVAAAEEVVAEEIFEHIRIDEYADSSGVEMDPNTSAEGVVYVGKVDQYGNPAELPATGVRSVKEGVYPQAIEGTTEEVPLLFLDRHKIEKAQVEGTFTAGIYVEVKYYMSMELFKEDVYYVDVALKGIAKFEGEIALEKKISIPILKAPGEIKTEVITISYMPALVIEASFTGNISTTVEGGLNITCGKGIDEDNPDFALKADPYWSVTYVEIGAEIVAAIGVEWSPTITVADEMILNAQLTVGVKAQLSAKMSYSLNESSETEEHSCDLCLAGSLDVVFPLSGKIYVLNQKIYDTDGPSLEEEDFEAVLAKINLGDFYFSVTHGQFGLGQCPYGLVEITVTVVDGSLVPKPVAGALISVDNNVMKIAGGSSTATTATTGADGRAKIKVVPGNRYFMASHASADGVAKVGTVSYQITEELKHVKITLGNMDRLPDDKAVKELYWHVSDSTPQLGAVITENGVLYMWGDNRYGQLGNASTTSSDLPTRTYLYEPVKKFVADYNHNTVGAITESGKLYMWGYNSDGQLAQGNTDNKTVPILVSNFTRIGTENSEQEYKVKNLVMYEGAVAAILENGDLYMWGRNRGRFGDGTTNDHTIPHYVMSEVKDVKISRNNTAVLKNTGEMYVWGYGYDGMLGNGKYDKCYSIPEVPVLENVKSIQISLSNAAAVLENDDLYTWGANGFGQVGNDSTATQLTPVKVLSDVDRVFFSDYAGGSYFSAAITNNKELYMWGYNCDGQLGLGHRENKTRPTKVESIKSIKDISLFSMKYYAGEAYSTTCVTDDGDLWIWGSVHGPYNGLVFHEPKKILEEDILFMGKRDDYHSSSIYLVMQDGSLVKFSNYSSDTNKQLTLVPIEPPAIQLASTGLGETTVSDNTIPRSVSFNNLLPNELYNFYAMKSGGVEELLGEDNLLSVAQGISDAEGNLSVEYLTTRECTYPYVFVMSESEPDISAAEIRVENLVYNGTEQFVEPVVVYEGKTLEEGKDYLVAGHFSATDVGEYKLTIIGIGYYGGEKEVTYRVLPRVFNVLFDSDGGSFVEPQGVEEGSCVLEPEIPHKDGFRFIGWYFNGTIYDFNTAVTDSITLTAKWVEMGTTESEEYGNVLPEDIPADGIPEGLWIAGVEKSYSYTGKPIKPEVRVYDSDRMLMAGHDYTISYRNNTRANDASIVRTAPTITVKGKGNYSGKETQTFVIEPISLSDNSVQTENITLAYNKKVQKPVPVLTFNGKKLVNKRDFTVSYPALTAAQPEANRQPGTYEILVEAKSGGNFTGTRTLQLVITERLLLSKVKVARIPAQTYGDWKGRPIEPQLTITMKGEGELKKDQDYTITYADNDKVGTATAILTGMGEYAGTKKVSFQIVGENLKKAAVTGIADATYDGMAKEPVPVLTLNGRTLAAGENYEVAYSKNVNVGTATVTISGINDCTGVIKKTFKIRPFDLEGDYNSQSTDRKVTGLEGTLSVKYLKGGSKPVVKLTFNNMVLKEGTDYTVTYKNNKKAALATEEKAPTMVIKGKKNFQGTISKPFTIERKALDDALSPVTITAEDVAYVKKAGKFMSKPMVTDADGALLKAGKDYDITYTTQYGSSLTKKNVVEANTVVRVKATGKGDYEGGTIETTYRITPADFKKAKISITPQVYTGEAIYLETSDIKSVKVKGADITGEYGTSYEIVEGSYKKNVKKGTASVTLRGKGNYGGNKTVTFKITARSFVWFWRIFG